MSIFLWACFFVAAAFSKENQENPQLTPLQDGVPFTFVGGDSSTKQFSYQPLKDSKLLVMSGSVLDIDLSCVTHGQPLEKSVKHSHILNISVVELTKQQCDHYLIRLDAIQNNSRYTLLVN